MPVGLQNILNSKGYKIIKCQRLEGAESCHPLSIAASLTRHNSERMASISNDFAATPNVKSRFYWLKKEQRRSPYTQAAAVSYYLAEALRGILSDLQRMPYLRSVLKKMNELGCESIILTAINTFHEVYQNSGEKALWAKVDELLNDVRQELNQFGSLETAILLSIATGESMTVIDASHEKNIRIIRVINNDGLLELVSNQVDLELEPGVLDALIVEAIENETLRFVIAPGYGLLPIEFLENTVDEDEPTIVAGRMRKAVRRPNCSTNPYIWYDACSNKYLTLRGGDAESRQKIKLKPKRSDEPIHDKWKRFYRWSKEWQQTRSSARAHAKAYRILGVLAVSSFGTYMYVDEKLRHVIYQYACGESDVWQCVSGYLGHAKEAGQYASSVVYSSVCGDTGAWKCGRDYYNWTDRAIRYTSSAVYGSICGTMSLSECRDYYKENYLPKENYQ
ncbi:hypothetical protein [Endozoicomonas montiporae]|nr:hypothetical protein [Endozoicomonas montiporae]